MQIIFILSVTSDLSLVDYSNVVGIYTNLEVPSITVDVSFYTQC